MFTFQNSSMISIEYCPTSFFTFILLSSWRLPSIFPSSETSLTWGNKREFRVKLYYRLCLLLHIKCIQFLIKLESSDVHFHPITWWIFLVLYFSPYWQPKHFTVVSHPFWWQHRAKQGNSMEEDMVYTFYPHRTMVTTSLLRSKQTGGLLPGT